MKYGPFLLVILLFTGIYVLPSVFARFTGTHTIEYNATAGIDALQCQKCHSYVLDELTATPDAIITYGVHLNATGNSSYTLGWLNSEIDNTSAHGICHFCHRPQVDVKSLSHSKGIVRACTDVDCHGNNAVTNNTAYPAAGNVGVILGYVGIDSTKVEQSNVHEPWFNGMSIYNSPYYNETGHNYDASYYACLGCHTEVIVTKNVTRTPFDHTNATAFKDRYL